jgi:UDP-galactopyranose mutase
MAAYDVLVIGGGISGASFAFHAATAGRRVAVVEREGQAGGCLDTQSTPAGFWYELGGHTCYNSYGAFLELLEGCGLLGELQARGKSVLRFLEGDELVGGSNLLLLLKLFDKTELLRALPRWIGARQEGETVRSYYSRLVGSRNYARVLGPMLSAVPSQTADAFPATMLFKKRERRKDVLRSFTLRGGLRRAAEAALGQPGIESLPGRAALGVERSGAGFAATLDDGARLEADVLALAVPPSAAAGLLERVLPEVSAQAAKVREAHVESLGFAVRADRVGVPYATFFIPLEDAFHSIVTRDVVSDADWRGFAVHFRPGTAGEERVQRAARVLRIQPQDMEAVTERQRVLPSPVLGHADLVAAIDRDLKGQRIAVTGNWFAGLAIEDCVLRSRAEWQRIASGA